MVLKWKQVLVWMLFICCGLTSKVKAQSFQEGLKLYQNHKYKQSAKLFSHLQTQKADLFAGKAYLGAGNYVQAKTFLKKVKRSENPDLFWESQYSTALLNFQLGDFSTALNDLYNLKKSDVPLDLVDACKTFYHQILNYLTFEQRRKVFKKTSYKELKYQLVYAALGKVSYEEAQKLADELHNISDISDEQKQKVAALITDSARYASVVDTSRGLQAPNGITYQIGVALPSFNAKNQNFDVSQGLYYGYLMAAERFNETHEGKKIMLHYQNTGVKIDSSKYYMDDMMKHHHLGAVLGPLFSRSLKSMASQAAQYKVPLVAPLANSDTMGINKQFVFRANPSFAVHGKEMAKYAVDTLNLHRFAVIVERNSLGEKSAYAFRKQVKKMGGDISYFFDEDFTSTGFDLSQYTRQINLDSSAVSFHIDAIYAPFTGQTGASLIRLLIGDFQSKSNTVSILGSQQWGEMQIPATQLHGQDIYYTKSYAKQTQANKLSFFRKKFKERFKAEPNRFAMIGYDVGGFLFKSISKVQNPALLDEKLSKQHLYRGIITDIKLDSSGINQRLEVLKIRQQKTEGFN